MVQHRRENLLRETGAVGVVRGVAVTSAADPVRDLFEDHGVSDQQLHVIWLGDRYPDRDSHQVALTLECGPAALPGGHAAVVIDPAKSGIRQPEF